MLIVLDLERFCSTLAPKIQYLWYFLPLACHFATCHATPSSRIVPLSQATGGFVFSFLFFCHLLTVSFFLFTSPPACAFATCLPLAMRCPLSLRHASPLVASPLRHSLPLITPRYAPYHMLPSLCRAFVMHRRPSSHLCCAPSRLATVQS
jgi:hypothetical protein